MSPDLRRDKVAILKQYYMDIIACTKAFVFEAYHLLGRLMTSYREGMV